MTCTEENEALINRRRYKRYEIDTEVRVAMLGLEQRGTMRGRTLNISEAGITGVFVTVWDVGTPVHPSILSARYKEPGPDRRNPAQPLRLPLRV